MKSIAQQKFGESNYKFLNKNFPGIEGSFLSAFDAIIVMCELTGKTVRFKYSNAITIVLLKSAYIELTFDTWKKRMILCFHGVKKDDILKEIKEKHNIFHTFNKQHAGFHGVYEFKYNQKNCKKMLNIIQLMVSKEWIMQK